MNRELMMKFSIFWVKKGGGERGKRGATHAFAKAPPSTAAACAVPAEQSAAVATTQEATPFLAAWTTPIVRLGDGEETQEDVGVGGDGAPEGQSGDEGSTPCGAAPAR